MNIKAVGYQQVTTNQQKQALWLTLGLLLLIGFWFRVDFLFALIFHTDEYFSMLAARMVAQQGLPILPSGLFYDHGLLFSMFSGLLIATLEFKEEIARWPSLLLGTLTIALYYRVAYDLFKSKTTGLLAATLIATDSASIYWSGRARMYAMAHLFVLLTLVWLLKSMFQSPNRWQRYLFLIFLFSALLSHTVVFVILPPLIILLLVFTIFYDHRWLRQRRLWLQAGIALLLIGAVSIIVALGQTSSTISLQDEQVQAPALAGLGPLAGFFNPGWNLARFDNFVDYFQIRPNNWLTLLISLNSLTVLHRFIQKKTTFADWVFCFLLWFIILTVTEQAVLLTSSWRKARYLYILTLPAFLLLSAQSVKQLGITINSLLSRFFFDSRQPEISATVLVIAIVIIVAALPGTETWNFNRSKSTGDYPGAFEFVKEAWQPEDKVMTIQPAASYLYLNRTDYYANQTTAKVLVADEESENDDLVDRYTGAPLIDSVDELNAALSTEKRLWFVSTITHVFSHFESYFTQQIFSQMNYAKQSGQIYVFLSETFPRPLPFAPGTLLDEQFGNIIRLEGYNLALETMGPDGSLPLHLYWKPVGTLPQNTKVFVQLRNNQNQTVAQADHFFYENIPFDREWDALKSNGEWLRETAMLYLSWPLPADGEPYRLYVGLYQAETFERIPLLNDTSGENAVIISFP